MIKITLKSEFKGMTEFECMYVTDFTFNNKKYRQYWMHPMCYWMLPLSMVKSEQEL